MGIESLISSVPRCRTKTARSPAGPGMRASASTRRITPLRSVLSIGRCPALSNWPCRIYHYSIAYVAVRPRGPSGPGTGAASESSDSDSGPRKTALLSAPSVPGWPEHRHPLRPALRSLVRVDLCLRPTSALAALLDGQDRRQLGSAVTEGRPMRSAGAVPRPPENIDRIVSRGSAVAGIPPHLRACGRSWSSARYVMVAVRTLL
jgi:hypothetical protein